MTDETKPIIRDNKGRFVKGAPSASPGRPARATEKEYLEAMIGKVSLDDWQNIIAKAVQQARKGDRAAREWLANYIMGKPADKVQISSDKFMKVVLKFSGQTETQIDTTAEEITEETTEETEDSQ